MRKEKLWTAVDLQKALSLPCIHLKHTQNNK